jgi:hypothetical protein
VNSSTTSSDEAPRLRRYGRRVLALAALCTLAAGALNALIDPYDLAGHPLPGLAQDELSRLRNDRLLELARFNREPRPIIVLGDSRAQNLREEFFAEQGLSARNLAYGGGTVYEAIDTFDFAARRTRLQAVVMVVPFNSWSESDHGNLVENAVGLIERPATYYFNADILRASVANVAANWLGDAHPSQAPPMTGEAFWRYQLDYNARSYYERWQQPERLERLFLDMVAQCRSRGIRLLLVVPPTHVDLQRLIPHYRLEKQHEAYLALLEANAETLNFDVVDAVTSDRAKFSDPFHILPSESRGLVAKIAGRLRSAPP